MKKKMLTVMLLSIATLVVIDTKSPISAVESDQQTVVETSVVEYTSKGGSEFEAGTFRTQLTVGDTGQIRRPQSSPLKDSLYSFGLIVSDPSVLSFDEQGNWVAHKAGTTRVTFGFPSSDSEQGKKFQAELDALGVRLHVDEVLVYMDVTVTEAANDTDSKAMYRLYNPNNLEHFYTASAHERDTLVKMGWGKYEGVAWQAPSTGVAVYRLYNPILRDHHYTSDRNEVNVLTSKHHWKEEGIAWYSGGTQKVYRLFHPGLKTGSHHYTLDENEVKVLQSRGWKYEGIAWYGQ